MHRLAAVKAKKPVLTRVTFLRRALVLKRLEINIQEAGSIWSKVVAENVKICVGGL